MLHINLGVLEMKMVENHCLSCKKNLLLWGSLSLRAYERSTAINLFWTAVDKKGF